VGRRAGTPAYLKIASDCRARILDGSLPAGAKLPSESELMRSYSVSRIVAKMAINVLRNEGLIVSHKGKGSFVKEIRRIIRDSTNRYSRTNSSSTSPFASDTVRSGQRGDWEFHSDEITATEDVAHRLEIEFGAPVMCTKYRYFAATSGRGDPIQLSTSWEPLELTVDSPIVRPEEGPIVGVVARMDSIGVHISHVTERVTARAALPPEIQALELSAQGSYILLIQRTHYAGERPVETCDIVFPGDRYELTYRIPVS
jgi:DNA-binding GntR family transcriptional regulator